MNTAKSLQDLVSANNSWMVNYMAINPGSNEIVNYMISEKLLKTGFSCATGNKCQKLQKDCKDPECEELRIFLLCFSCDRIFHQRCANVAEADLTDERTPWLCFECINDPLNDHASQFFKSGGVKLFLKDRLDKYTTEIELPSPIRGKSLDETNQDYHDSFFDLSEIEKSLHINFGDLQPINVSRLLGTKLINQQEEVEQMKRIMLQSEQEKLDLKNQLAQKSEENSKLRQLEQTWDSKSARVMHNPPQLSSTLVMNHPSHHTSLNSTTYQVPGTSNTLRQSHVDESASKMKELSYSIKVLTANDIMEQIARELNQQTSSTTNNAKNSTVHQNSSTFAVPHNIVPSKFSSYLLPINENPSEPLSLRDIRKSLPKIDKFDGNVDEWLTFERAVERNVREGQYTDSLAKNIIRQALTGQPLERIDSIYNYSTASEIMNYLRISYGCSNNIVASARNKLMALKLAKPLTHSSAMEVTTKITSYMAACRYAQLPILDMSISMHIHSQLDQLHQQQYYRYFYEKYPGMTRTERLDAQFEFLNELANTLPMGDIKNQDRKDSGRNFNVLSTSFGNPKNDEHTNLANSKLEANNNKNNKDDFKYEIRSKDKAPYLGYDIEKVNLLKRKCEFCSKVNHYSLECSEYRAMPMDQRYNAVKSRGLCINCLLTTEHTSSECTLKLGCGHNFDNYGKCSQKHHITLHRGRSFTSNSFNRNPRRRFTYNRNNNRNNSGSRDSLPPADPQTPSAPAAENISSNPPITQQPATSQQNNNQYQGYTAGTVSLSQPTENPPKGFRLCNTCSHLLPESSQRTIKLFNTYFYGNEKKAIGYAVGDSAAEITLVKRQLVDELGIVGQPCTIELLWTDSEVKTRQAIKVDLKISGILPDSELLTLKECYAINDFNLPPRSLNVEKLKKQFPYLRDIPFDSYFDAIPCILIGSRDAHMIEAIEPVTQGGNCKPVALKSKLGFTIYGGAPESHESDSYTIQAVASQNIKYENVGEITNKQLDDTYAYSCSVDSLGIKRVEQHLTLDEKKAIEILKEEMKILKDGTVEVPLVWNRDFRKNIPQLINNFPMALQRQLALEARLKKHPELWEAYIRNFKKLIDETYVRAATYEDMEIPWKNINFIPTSIVVNENKQPLKPRIVYDASAKYKGSSLNDHLLMGPNLLVDMLKPLMRMRMNHVAFTADVKSMFHRIRISPRDQQCQRLMWRESTNQPMQIFIQQTMLFGPKCSPFCSQFVKNEIADKYVDKFPDAANALKMYTYMDDLLTSEKTVDKAIEVAVQCIDILKSINWDLIGFQSNSAEFLRALPESHVKRELIPLMSDQEASYTTKVLGLAWNPKADTFVFQLDKNELIKMVKDDGHKPTKRNQFSTIARIFDANGFLTHCIIRGRILVQRSWRNKLDWDDEISDQDNRDWIKWLNDLQNVSKLQIPRKRFKYANMSDVDSLELHTFCDAGKEAFATSSYFVATINSYRYISQVMAKAKVAPINMKTKKEVTEIPRLELLACVIGARLTKTIENLHQDLKFDIFIWTDSEIALRWIKNPNQHLPKFAESPITDILDHSEPENWRHIDSKNNVADIATKFKPFDFGDINSEWFQGPKFLKLPQEHWPAQKIDFSIPKFNLNVVVREMVHLPFKLPPINCPCASDYIIDLFPAAITSNWKKLERAVARALKIYFEIIIPVTKAKVWNNINACKQFKDAVNIEELSSAEILRGQLFIIRRMQRESYGEDYKRLLSGKGVKSTELAQLNVFLDQDGVMRISSRVSLPHDVYAQQNAPVVPRKNVLSDILLIHYHYLYKHVCLESQIADFRSTMWMPQLRAGLQKAKAFCNDCICKTAKPIPPKMAALPEFRADPTLKPFQVTGLDCAGPIIIYNYGKAKKVWILIFTCCMSRFVHLQLLDNLDTLCVLEAILTLWAAHGPVTQFISDNGTNFVGASRIIDNDRKEMCRVMYKAKDSWNKDYAPDKYCTWRFIPVQSPWFGGVYERLIKEVKRAIRSSTENRKIAKVELNMALQEAAHRINCRPLTHNSICTEDEEVLTPHHLAKNRSGWPLLPSIHGMKEVHDPLNDKSLYRRGRMLGEDMIRRFIAYYLPVLTKRDKWFKDSPPIKDGDLVLLCDPNKFRQAWERAKIIKIYKSNDNRSRVADIQMPDGTIRQRRSVNRLAKLNLQKLA